ncbi:hypothetical protein BDW74DRAFT_83058 [Aspergillus multicolor]|uniref:uncharacterized protein n=1 Tax=Aspergillus multicolor TaxID=41759 RepID=UPI003CCE0589
MPTPPTQNLNRTTNNNSNATRPFKFQLERGSCTSMLAVPEPPPVPDDAPEIVRKNWANCYGRYIRYVHRPRGVKEILRWNYGSPVIWGNVLSFLVVLVMIVTWDWVMISTVCMVSGLGTLGVVDYWACRWWLRRYPFRVDPLTEWWYSYAERKMGRGVAREKKRNSWF